MARRSRQRPRCVPAPLTRGMGTCGRIGNERHSFPGNSMTAARRSPWASCRRQSLDACEHDVRLPRLRQSRYCHIAGRSVSSKNGREQPLRSPGQSSGDPPRNFRLCSQRTGRTANQRPSNRKSDGGRGGIRTHGTVSRTPVFKTGSLNHSDTLP